MNAGTFGRAVVAGGAYFAVAFGAGFCMALVRIPFLEPRLGARWAELIEMPFMLAVISFGARWIVRRFAVPPAAPSRLGVGFVGLALMLAAEFGLVLPLRGMTIERYFASRDPVSATAYYLLLALFAFLPWLLAVLPPRRSPRRN
jgi:hypothetical protein